MWENKGNEAAERKEGRVLPDIEAQQQSDEDTRDDNVSQSQHGKVAGLQTFLQQVLWKHHWSGAKTGGETGQEVSWWSLWRAELKLTRSYTALTFDWCFKWLGNSHHDVGPKHLETHRIRINCWNIWIVSKCWNWTSGHDRAELDYLSRTRDLLTQKTS